MNEEYVKHLMKQNPKESAIELWFQFVGTMILFGLALLSFVGLCLWIAS